MNLLKTVAIAITLLLFGCKQDAATFGNINIQLTHKVDTQVFEFNAMNYTCAAGYTYKISRFQYYLSGFALKDSKGNLITSKKVFYVDAQQEATQLISLAGMPLGSYTDIYFYIGLDTAQNKSNALDATIENANMSWPDAMGGGYHFLKLEGYYTGNSGNAGFAMHLGKNGNAVPIHIEKKFEIQPNQQPLLSLNMNLNEWLKNPEVYDFAADGSYSMNNDSAMKKLYRNGVDVFN